MKQKKIIVFLSSGIGNVILLIPILKRLKSIENSHVTIFLNSPFVSKEFLISNNFPFDELIDSVNNFSFLIKNLKAFNYAYLDYSSSSVINLAYASILSKKVIAMRKNKLFLPFVNFVDAEPNIHSAVQNLRLLENGFKEKDFKLDQIEVDPKLQKPAFLNNKNIDQIFVSVQVSSANNNAKYKNWPIEYWIDFLNKIIDNYPQIKLILLGDNNEIKIGQIIEKSLSSDIFNLIGKTDLVKLCEMVYHSDIYIGLDSGIMHLAVAYNKPTFTIWGGSNPELFGYSKFSTRHTEVSNKLDCGPCNAWVGANKTRVVHPKDCPDIKCMKDLTPSIIFKEFEEFIKNLQIQ